MKYSDLAPYKFHSSSISERDLFVKLSGKVFQQASKRIGAPSDSNAYGDRILDLPATGNGEGLWIPYRPHSNVYDYVRGIQGWAASGPFSGCYFYVGLHRGCPYVAHVSCESAKDTNVTDWEKSEFAKGTIFKKKIGMATNLPLGTMGAAAIVFANISGGEVEVTRVDVRTTNPGSMAGMIFDVTKLTSD
jgi:hypothetical protein